MKSEDAVVLHNFGESEALSNVALSTVTQHWLACHTLFKLCTCPRPGHPVVAAIERASCFGSGYLPPNNGPPKQLRSGGRRPDGGGGRVLSASRGVPDVAEL